MVITFKKRIPTPNRRFPTGGNHVIAHAMQDRAPPPGSFTTVAEGAARGQRLDRFLADAIGTLSRSRVKSLIEQGQLRRDGQVLSEPADPVRPGATYVLNLPAPLPATPQPQHMALTILYEDSDLLVLDKPAGLVVHPAPGNLDGTLVNALLAHCGEQLTGIGGERRPGIVHRLDKDTSGVMVIAKTQQASTGLTAAFAARDLDRAYLALAWGLPAPLAGDIEGAIGRDPRDRKRMAIVTRGGRLALTHYRTLRAWQISVALLECRLATGRTHQIRVHLASRGHPIVGDPVYLRRVPAAARTLPEPLRHHLLDFPRQALHAARLGFAHPRTGKPLSFATDPPDDMRALINALDRDMRPVQS
jgi:23S rRNA pseudouridine1911/1915/1917 synthase